MVCPWFLVVSALTFTWRTIFKWLYLDNVETSSKHHLNLFLTSWDLLYTTLHSFEKVFLVNFVTILAWSQGTWDWVWVVTRWPSTHLEWAVIVVTFWVCVARLCLRLLSPEERCKFHHNLFVLSSSGSPTVLRVMRVLLVSGCCYIGHYIGIIYSRDIIMYDIWSTYLQNGAQNQVSIVLNNFSSKSERYV